MRSTFIHTIIAAAAMTAASAALAQNYPSRPVRIVVVSTPGGSVDTMARTVGPKLAERWGQQVLVDNRPGAGGAIAAEIVAKSPPDGYTLIMGTVASFATNVSLRKSLPYDPVKDFSPITLVATQNLMLLIHPSVPAKSVRELTALARKQPGKLSFASAGNGTGGHLSGELYRMLANIDMLHIPYKGVQPALIDVASGQVSMTFASIISAMPQVKSNRLLPLAVTGGQRSPAARELPTMMEAGVKGYEAATWYGLLAPAGIPADIAGKLNAEVVAILKSPEMSERLSREGADPVGNSAAEFARYIQSEIEKWRKVIRAAGIQPS
ncbi:MAG: tripartite tricarboxylate transporter substrate binding protein [Burkholderiales bacterium]|nr:tripartite tricarboxylate transporter substrate binding protein [Burkholderiales bacterium]